MTLYFFKASGHFILQFSNQYIPYKSVEIFRFKCYNYFTQGTLKSSERRMILWQQKVF